MADRIHDAFDSVKAESQLKESTKQFLSEERVKRTKHFRRPAFHRTLAAACAALVLVMGIGGYSWLKTPVSYVGIDINPSIELALNRLDHVVSAKGYNDEGEEIIRNLSLRGNNYKEAINEILESDEMAAYLTDESELVFTVAADGGREGILRSGIESCAGYSGHNSTSVCMNIDDVSEAHNHGISLGKYHAWMKLKEYEEPVTIDECKDMTMSEMHDLIHEHEEGGHEHGHGSETDNEADQGIENDAGFETENVIDYDIENNIDYEMDHETGYDADHDVEEKGNGHEYRHGGGSHHRE